jgi:hypothetical protein
MEPRTVNDRQLSVLRWIADECPERGMTDSSYKISAVALRNRGLAAVSKRGGWHASITDAGRHYLDHGAYPGSPPPKLTVPRKPRVPRRPSPEPIEAPSTADDARVADAPAPVIDPPGTPERIIRVPARLAKPHPIIAEARDKNRLPVSKRGISRAVRIAHALVIACEQQGWTVQSKDKALTRWGHPWSDKALFVVDTGEYRQGVYMAEENDRSEHVLTVYEQKQKDRYGYSYAPKYDYTASGRLFLEIESRYSGRRQKWADRQRWTIEEKLGQIIDEIEARSLLEREDRLERERKEAERQQRVDVAVAEATALYQEEHREQMFLDELARWHEANQRREYLTAMTDKDDSLTDPEARREAQQWLDWCQERVTASDPLEGEIRLPNEVAPSEQELRPLLPDWVFRRW